MTATRTTPPEERAARPLARDLAIGAGVLYVIVVVFGLFAELVVRARLVEPGDPTTTAANIAASEWLFRVGFAADLVVFLADVALAVVLYRLLEPVNRTLSLLAAAFRLTQTAVLGMNLLNMFQALRILDGADYLAPLGREPIEALALLSLDAHSYGYLLGLTFFGVATAIVGSMAVSSPQMPTALGVLLVVAGAGYLVDAAMFFLVPGYDGGVSAIVLAPAVVAEAWFALWLLTRAGRRPSPGRRGVVGLRPVGRVAEPAVAS